MAYSGPEAASQHSLSSLVTENGSGMSTGHKWGQSTIHTRLLLKLLEKRLYSLSLLDCFQRWLQQSLPSQIHFCNMTLPLPPLRGRLYFPSNSIWVGPLTCFDQNAKEVTLPDWGLDLKRTGGFHFVFS